MTTLRKHLLAIASGLAVAGLSYASASAAPVTLTWDPAGSSPALSTAINFSFTNITLQSYTTLALTPTGLNTFSVQDQGFLPVATFNNPGPLVLPGMNGNVGATAYGMYVEFTATSALTCSPGSAANCSGTSSALSYSLMGDPGYNTTFGFDPTTGLAVASGAGTDIALANGVLANCGAPSPTCQNTVGQSGSVPSAAVTTTFNQGAGEGGFFISPPSTVTLNLFASFVNNTSEVTCYDDALGANCGTGVTYGGAIPSGQPSTVAVLFQIGNIAPAGGTAVLSPGGGSATFNAAPIPEPASLSLLGAGLLGLGGALRRRSRKASAVTTV